MAAPISWQTATQSGVSSNLDAGAHVNTGQNVFNLGGASPFGFKLPPWAIAGVLVLAGLYLWTRRRA